MRITRRQAVALLTATKTGAGAQQARTSPQSPEELLKGARDRVRRNIEALAKVSVPAATEPAFQFKAS